MLNNEKVRAAKSNDQDVRVVCLDGASVSIEDIAAIAGQNTLLS